MQHITSRRKTRVLGALVIVGALVLAGCQIDTEYNTVLNADGTGTISMRSTLDKELWELGQSEGELSAEAIQEELPEGYTVDVFETDDGGGGVTISADFTSPQDGELVANTLAQDQGGLPYEISLSIVENVATYKAFVPGGLGPELGIEDMPTGDLFTATVSAVMPGEVIESNATRVEGDRLIWDVDLTSESPQVFEATSDISKGGGINGALIWGLLLLLLVVGSIVVLTKMTRRDAIAGGPAGADVDLKDVDTTGLNIPDDIDGAYTGDVVIEAHEEGPGTEDEDRPV